MCTGWYAVANYNVVVIAVFLSHWIFDRTYLAIKWMNWFGSFDRIENNDPHKLWAYVLVDNSFHLTFLWIIGKFII